MLRTYIKITYLFSYVTNNKYEDIF